MNANDSEWPQMNTNDREYPGMCTGGILHKVAAHFDSTRSATAAATCYTTEPASSHKCHFDSFLITGQTYCRKKYANIPGMAGKWN